MVRCKIHNDKAHLLVPVLQLSVKETGDPQVRFGAGRARERQLLWGTEGPGVHSVHQEVSTRPRGYNAPEVVEYPSSFNSIALYWLLAVGIPHKI